MKYIIIGIICFSLALSEFLSSLSRHKTRDLEYISTIEEYQKIEKASVTYKWLSIGCLVLTILCMLFLLVIFIQ
jgi:hypothetical protein